MRRFFIALLLLFPLLLTVNASAQGDAEAGEALWKNRGLNRCVDCHGTNGEGAFGPDLAGRELTLEQFTRALRQPWGIMPAYPPALYSDQEVSNLHAYLSNLPRVAEPGPWRTPLPPNAPRAQELLIAGVGCAQCHGDGLGGPRADAGALDADFDWWKDLVYDHAATMNGVRVDLGENPGPIRMGNYSRARLPESVLEEIYVYLKNTLGYRVGIASSVTRGSGAGSYNLVVGNSGKEGLGLTAENISVTLNLAAGTTVTDGGGAAFQGVTNGSEAVWRIPRLGPAQEQTITFTLGGGGAITSGAAVWHREGRSDRDQGGVAVPR
jgi:mono/diheme cytochrome c family protein